MKKLTTVLSSVAIAAFGAFFFASCTNPSSPATTVGAPSNLMALSKDANTISIEWTRGANDTAAEKVILSSSAVTDTLFEPSSVTQLNLNVTEGVVYTMTVVSSGGSSNTITWMSARRTPVSGQANLRVYQYSSSGNPSGLQMNGSDGHAHVVSVSTSNSGIIDFILDDTADVNSLNNGISTIVSPTGMTLEVAGAYDATWKHLWVGGNAHYVVGGLDNDWSSTSNGYSSDTTAIFNLPEASRATDYPIPSGNTYNTTGSRVLLVLTDDGHFAKVEVVPQSNGQLFGGTWPNQYVDLKVSYQNTVNQPYAARARSHNTGLQPRIHAQ